MNVLIRLLTFCLDPLHIGRRFLLHPALNFAFYMFDKFRIATDDKINTFRELILRIGLLAFAVALIIWSAVFMYAAFYYIYMPPISHTRPVHMQFKTCLDTSTPCTFPNAHVSLSKKQQLLMVGQAYRVIIKIDMPESPQNLDLGMFMVCAEMRDHESLLRGHSCRSAMMRYRSPLVRTITTWALSPLLIFGLKEEFQEVFVEVFNQYLEQDQHPITDVYIEIQSQKIQFYTVSLFIIADFTGLRYIMYNRPVMSAIIGISTNLFFILIVFLLSWYHWSDCAWLTNMQYKYKRITTTLQQSATKALLAFKNSLHDEELSYPDDEKSFVSNIEDFHGIEEEHILRRRKMSKESF